MPSWPTREAPSANNWLDHFPGSSLNARWTALTSGTGAVTVTDSYVSMTSGGSGGATGIYYATKLDTTKNQLWQVCIAGQHTSGASRVLEVINGASAPTAVSDATRDPNRRLGFYLLGGGSSDAGYMWYYNSSHAEYRWDASAWTASGSFAVQPVGPDSYYVLELEIDARNSRFRMLWRGRNRVGGGSIFDQGLRLFALSDWVTWGTLEATADLWLTIGTPLTDFAASKEWRCEWVRYAESPSRVPYEGWVAAKNLLGDGHIIKHSWSYDGENYLPEDRTTIALDKNGANAWEAGEIQAPTVVYDGVNTDYMFYVGMSADFATTGIGVAKTPHEIPQNGTWTRGTGNPIISPIGGETNVRYGHAWMDWTDPDPNKRWKAIFVATSSVDSKRRLQLATAPDPPDTSTWTRQGTILDAGTTGADDEGGMEGAVSCYHEGTWHVFYEGYNAAQTVSKILHASGPSLTNLTKSYAVFYAAQASGDTALTANLTNSRTVTVSSTTGFSVDGFVLIDQDTDYDVYAVSRVRKIVNSTTLELYHALDGFTTTLPARIRQVDRVPHGTPRAVVRVGNEWWFYVVSWGYMDGNTGISALCEQVILLTHSAATPDGAVPVLDKLAEPVLMRNEFGGQRSVENFSFFNYPVYPEGATQAGVPSSDVSAGTWTNQAGSGSNLYQSTDELEPWDDTDYIQSVTDPSSAAVTLGLSTISDVPVNSRHVVRYRISRT